jgi:hypothetical protein
MQREWVPAFAEKHPSPYTERLGETTNRDAAFLPEHMCEASTKEQGVGIR